MKTSLGTAATIGLLWALVSAAPTLAQAPGNAGLRFGIGTDIEGGIAFGGTVDYTLPRQSNAFELGLTLFYGSFEEESNNGFNDYFETTDIFAVAAIANYLFRHSMDVPGPYFVVGAGVGAFSVSWREESPTDLSLGPPLPGGGTYQEEDGVSGGAIINFGIGHRFTEKVDLRAQVPTFFIGGGEEREGGVIPTFTLTLGIAF
jgi:hypothetical protein